jgi:ribonuclease BN (tRNA processing enzyme)
MFCGENLKLIFLGSGGGRFVTLRQIRKTGGFYLEYATKRIYVDPGPGALVNSRRMKIPLEELDILVITHNHTDHVNDANVIIEAMTHGCKTLRGTLVTNTAVLRGYGNYDRYITSYHRGCLAKILEISGPTRLRLSENLELEAIQLRHDEPLTFGFKLYSKYEPVFGYISDTEYFDELPKAFRDAEFLVINCIANYGRKISGHLSLDDVERILENSEAKKVIITHLGFTILRDNLAELQERLRRRTGKNVEFARDFMKIVYPEKDRQKQEHQTRLDRF